MTAAPETHYTRAADGTNLAYQITDDGPIDLVFYDGAPAIDLLSDDPGFVRVRGRLGSYERRSTPAPGERHGFARMNVK
jgi:hypothetical protein